MSTAAITLSRDNERAPGTIFWDIDLALPSEADIPFDSFVAGSGWHPAEIFEGVCFRWMGAAATARVAAMVDRTIDLEFSLYVPHISDHARWGEVTFCVDGEPVAATLVLEDVRRFVLQVPARPPRAPDGSGPVRPDALSCVTEIEICAPFAIQINPSDARTLSIGVSLLRIRPIASEALARNRLVVRAALLSYFTGRDLSDLFPGATAPGGTP